MGVVLVGCVYVQMDTQELIVTLRDVGRVTLVEFTLTHQ